MVVIWKHPLALSGIPRSTLRLTRGARVLHFAQQGLGLYLWEVHDVNETEEETHTFEVVGTGNAANVDPGRFIATTLVDGGTSVFHLFEVTG